MHLKRLCRACRRHSFSSSPCCRAHASSHSSTRQPPSAGSSNVRHHLLLRSPSSGAPMPLHLKRSQPHRARRALLGARAPGVPGAAPPPVAEASASRTWRSGSADALWCIREAEMLGAAEPARPSPRPGAPAGGAGHDRGADGMPDTVPGWTVFHLPSTP